LRLNKIISQINKYYPPEEKIPSFIGEFQPGYLYGNVKIHKPNNPLRPIISQIPTVTYPVAKYLCKILTPYVPNDFNIASSREFIDNVTSTNSTNYIASLDVENLFTNVPVHDTINIILNTAYADNVSPLKIPKNLLKSILEICTTQAPFISPNGKLYNQIDGIAMGSP